MKSRNIQKENKKIGIFYLCEDEEEKKELEQIYDENEKIYREVIKKKYNLEKNI